MHLLYFLGSFYPAQDGGPNNSLYWLSKNIAKNKSVHNVTVLSFFKNITEKDQKKFKIYPNKLIKFQKLNVIYCKYYFFRILSPYFFYFLFFKTRKFNLVHLNSIFFYINLICIFFFNLLNIKYCLSPRGELESKAIIYKKKLKKIYLFFFKKLLKRRTTVHTTSDKERKESKKLLGNDLIYYKIPNLIDVKKKFKKKIKYKLKKNLLFLGRLHPKKNIETCIFSFIDSFKKIKNKNVKFLIVGTGNKNYIKKLKDLVKLYKFEDKITFLGFLNHRKKDEIFLTSRFLILASHSENFGNVILESIQNKTPVLVSNNLPWKSIKKFRTGFLFNKNRHSITQTITKVFKMNDTNYKKLFKNMDKLIDCYDATKKSHFYLKMYNYAVSTSNNQK